MWSHSALLWHLELFSFIKIFIHHNATFTRFRELCYTHKAVALLPHQQTGGVWHCKYLVMYAGGYKIMWVYSLQCAQAGFLLSTICTQSLNLNHSLAHNLMIVLNPK